MNTITIRRSVVTFYAPLLCIVLAFGCYPAAKIPIDTVCYEAPPGTHRQLFIFLPGNGDAPDAFAENGFVKAVRARKLPIDMIAVNAHLGYYMEGTVFTRLKEDVIDPARARGYTNIWLVGNSLGGYGSISYLRQYPQDITGIVLLGPYLGEKMVVHEIREAGGLQKWEPGEITNSRDGWEKQLWKWLKDGRQQEIFWHWIKDCEEEHTNARIYLGYGKNDRFSYGQALLADSLPPDHVFAIKGGHNWRTWTKLWNLILDQVAAPHPVTHVEALTD
jgi:pimeloyl-ACP methyl ester carboxylesterase